MMKYKTDFLAEDYSGLCWFQLKGVSALLSILLSLALALMVLGVTKNIMIAALVVAISYPIILKIRKNGVIKRADRRYSSFGASSELYLEIDDDEIRQTAASGEVRLPWEDVYAVRESDTSYYVFLSSRKAFYFPKRSFESEEAKKEFIEYINKNVPKKKVKLKK